MAYTCVVLVLLALCGIACGQKVSTTNGTAFTRTTKATSTSKSNTTSAPITKVMSSTKPTTNVSTPVPKSNGTVTPNTTTTTGSSTARLTTVPTSKPGNHSTTPKLTPKVTPTPEGHGGNKSDRGKWVATGFAVVFFLTTVIMTVLYCRQRRIYRELEGDSSLSRLI